jgi:hypothetical protein
MNDPAQTNDDIADQITKIHAMLANEGPWTREFYRSLAQFSLTLLLVGYARQRAGITEGSIEASRAALAALGPQYEWPLQELAPERKP